MAEIEELPRFTGGSLYGDELLPMQRQGLTYGVPVNLLASLDVDAFVNDIAGRATHNTKAAGYRVLVANIGDGRAAIYSKITSASGNWSAAAYLTSSAREVLVADRVYYVRADGNDANTGLVNSAAGAFATLQKAANVADDLDLNGRLVTIKISAPGTYAGLYLSHPSVGGGVVRVSGDVANPASIIVGPGPGGHSITAQNGRYLEVEGVTVSAPGANQNGLLSVDRAHIRIVGNMQFGVCGGNHMYAAQGAKIDGYSLPYTIAGSAYAHMIVDTFGAIIFQGSSITLTGTPNFASAFAVANELGRIQINSITFSGAATGQRFYAGTGGVIQTYSGSTTYLPGSVAGSGTNFGVSPYGLYG